MQIAPKIEVRDRRHSEALDAHIHQKVGKLEEFFVLRRASTLYGLVSKFSSWKKWARKGHKPSALAPASIMFVGSGGIPTRAAIRLILHVERSRTSIEKEKTKYPRLSTCAETT